jgi:hypothetical protein
MTQPLVEDSRKTAIRRTVIAFIMLLCIVGLVIAVQHTRRGDEEIDITGGQTLVELLTPTNGATLVNQQQAQIGIDLTSAYDANLVINGILIPEDQLTRRPELNAVYFTPGEGKVIKQLPPGRNTVNALVFRVDGTPGTIPAVTWTFNVA